MNNFKKAALASAVLAAASASFEASAYDVTVSGAGNTIIGCAVPPNGSAGATVYSIDSYDSNAAINTGFPSWLKQGANCSRSVNWMIAQSSTSGSYLVNVTNQVASNGYTLQSFLFSNNIQGGGTATASSTALANSAVSMVGCAAPAGGTAGATVYSVDGYNSANTTANSGVTFSALGGNPCSAALEQAGAATLNTALNLRTADGAYSLMQYIVQ